MKPIPVSFHIGPLLVHTYGVGLAIAFYVGYRYLERRLRRNGFAVDWVPALFLIVLVTAIVGARAVHVVANLGFYNSHPMEIFAIWNGGLSSFGGLAFAIPSALFYAHRRCPSLGIASAFDITAPVLALSWSLGRILGPQMMVAGGGHITHAFYGMAYAGQVGKRVPVPVFQCLEDAAIWGILLLIERRLNNAQRNLRPGFLIGVAMVLWGVERAIDEYLWLAKPGKGGDVGVEIVGLILALVGGFVAFRTWRKSARTQYIDA
jgi:phosphatidylglycerol:prolipoprotein diacylglycerol transferase